MTVFNLVVAQRVALDAGMIVSNEPGLYLQDQYGIRIENLLVVTKSDTGESFLEFDPLTLVPIDRRLILVDLLDDQERTWMDAYHKRIYDTLTDQLDSPDREWLATMCKPLQR